MKIELKGTEKLPQTIMGVIDDFIRIKKYVSIDYINETPTNAGNWGIITSRGEDFIVFEPDYGGREIVHICNIIAMIPDDLSDEIMLKANIKRYEHLARQAREALERLKWGEYA